MVVMKTHLENRSSNCLRKYRIFFVCGLVLLCAQVYLAYNFLALENESQQRPGKATLEETNFSRDDEDEGLPKGTRQLKLPPDKQGSSNKALNRNRTTRVKLDRNSLNFVPACEVTGREAVSAITRAQSQMCKERIVNVTCLSQQNLLYPTKLQSSCPHSLGFVGVPKSLGCFKDDKISRLLPNYYAVFKTNNSPEHCAYMCLQSGFPYAGVEYSMECFCGKEEPSKTNQLPDSSCNMKCPGDPKQPCGGYLTINIFLTGIQRFKAQEARNSSLKSTDEAPVRIAYLLTVNGRASRQVRRLISILYDPSHLFYIHVDARQDYMYREMLEVERKCKNKNIIVAKGPDLRHASIWGGASLLTTFLTSARQMLLHSKNWDFLVNLSESDYPIKTNARLVEFLTWNRGMNFVKSHGREVQRFLTKQGLDKTFVECEARMWRVGDRKLPNGIQIDGGSDWVALSRDFVEYVARPEPDALVTGLLKIFRYTLLPAESFFHTALRNSRFCDTYVDNNLHVTNWKRKLGCKCQYKAVVDWCGCSPNDFKMEDFNRIRNTAEKNLFFARKFEPVIDQRIIDRVEQWLYPERANATTALTIKGYDSYWQSLYHHEDISPAADDALLTVSSSLARLVYQRFGEPPGIEGATVHLLETSAYFRENHFAGILIRAASDRLAMESSTLMTDFPDQVEALIYPKRNLSTARSWVGKITSMTINTDYDQKEQMFRNFLGGVGPMSSPALAYEFDASVPVPQNFTVLWLDPLYRLADINYLQIEESSLIGYLKPQLSDPLQIGIWNVFVILDSKIIVKLNFLVTPLTHWRNRPIGHEKSREVNHGPATPYHVAKDQADRWLEFLQPHITMKDTATRAGSEVRIGWQLERWVDTYIFEHYEVSRVCDAGEERPRSRAKHSKSPLLQRCIATDWSSLAPDPKSDVRSICQKSR
ncbi:xylosyltransferase oxt [Nasonia vitripennis]|uniref:protein xylosyltransferase n=1 Tax=Nasonia vitripennis TaxID=7425 RepID=A0A7M7G5I1_NASVI|nr:xylosyltransferase oxt [Nasonia vitripennis]